jgi:hypothetical protein
MYLLFSARLTDLFLSHPSTNQRISDNAPRNSHAIITKFIGFGIWHLDSGIWHLAILGPSGCGRPTIVEYGE